MPSSPPEDWRDRLYQDLSRDERERASRGGDAPPPQDLRAETLPEIPRYQISAVIGQGAAGTVYKAWDRELQRHVALKVLRPTVAFTEVARQRFRREAQATASLSHPHVIAAYDAGEHAGLLYIVMELVDGRPFSDILAAGQTSTTDLLRLLERASQGVGEAHSKGIVHRDLKPGNILVTAAGEPKVADFGLVHLVDSSTALTRTGSTLGTPLYMSPEQVEGRVEAITPRTDVYALGAMLYEVLTGRPPFQGETPMELYGQIVRDEPVPPRTLKPDIPRDLQTIALKALEKEPGRRYATANAFAEDLRRFREGEPVAAQSAGPAYRLYRRWRRNRVAWSLSFGTAVALLLAGFVWSRKHTETEKLVTSVRDRQRVSLDAIFSLRRAGANATMGAFVPEVETAYRQALESAPGNAEIEYLMGRLYRALMEDDKAEEFQKRALAKDPEYAPSLYERGILQAARFGVGMDKAILQSKALPAGQPSAEAAKQVPVAETEEVEGGRSELVALRDRIRSDCATLQKVIASGRESAGLRYVSEAHLKTVEGLLAFYRRDYDAARRILEEVVGKNPLIEEAWEALGRTVTRQSMLFESRSVNRDEVYQSWEETAQLWSRAISHDQGYVPHWLGRANANRDRALAFMKRGGDPVPDFRKAEADLGKVLDLTPKIPEALRLRGNVRELIGVYLTNNGKDPTTDFERSAADFDQAISRFGERSDLLSGRALLNMHWAQYRARQNEDPFPGFAAAEEDLTKAIRLNTQGLAHLHYLSLGNLKLSRAAALKRRGRDPLPDYDGAEADLIQGLRDHRTFEATWFALAEARLQRGIHRQELGQDAKNDLLQAEKDDDEALRLCHENSPAGLGHRGRVRSALGRRYESVNDAPNAVEAYRGAIRDFGKCLDLRKTLDPSQQKDFDEARRRLEALKPQ